jgi:hypothetical protein
MLVSVIKSILITVGLIICASTIRAQAPGVTPANPVIALVGTQQFTCTGTCTGGTGWSCSGCVGSISVGGLYTAPSTGTANQSLGGYQLLPNDHIYNTDISALAAASNSATIIASISGNLNFLPSFPVNYTNGSTPTTSMVFVNTVPNNGTFETPLWPSVRIQTGWFDALANGASSDHHLFSIDTTNGNIYEIYQFVAQAPVTTCTVNGSNLATCTITPTNTSSGFARAATNGSTVTVGGFTGGDTYLNGNFTLTAATVSTITFNITHASASTSTTGQATLAGSCSAGTCNSSGGAQYTYKDYALNTNGYANAAGTAEIPTILHSQEYETAIANSTAIHHAQFLTLSNGLICGSSIASSCCVGSTCNAGGTRHIWPATAEAFIGGGTIPYGTCFRLKSSFNQGGFSTGAQILLTDFKHYCTFLTDGGQNMTISEDFEDTPADQVAFIKEIGAANIAASNFEAVDISSLMESSSSGAVNTGERVCFNSSSGAGCTHVDLQNTAVNVAQNQVYVMAGTPQFQLVTYSNGATTCTMSPTVGSITSGCLYTAPASITVGTKSQTTVTVTSSVTNTVKAVMTVTVFPLTNFNIVQATSDYTDSHGVVWFSGGQYGFGMSNVPSWQGCCQNDSSFPNTTDKQLFYDTLQSSPTVNDYKMDFHVPNGTYLVTYNNGTIRPTGQNVRYFYGSGSLIGTVDPTVIAGGVHLPYTRTDSIIVNNGLLSYYNAGIGLETWNTGDVSSISIAQTVSGLAGSLITPGVKIVSGVSVQ